MLGDTLTFYHEEQQQLWSNPAVFDHAIDTSHIKSEQVVARLWSSCVSYFRMHLTAYLSGLSIILPNVLGQSGTPTGIAATAPTAPPSHLTAKLPALGWDHWNAYGCDINEAKILDAADAFVSLGLKDAGYEYINIDDCWSLRDRDAETGQIVPDPVKFPNGIIGVAEHVHSLGLKVGIYSDAGTTTCAGFPASLGREDLDAELFASWGIDYLKYDNCNIPSNWTDAPSPPDGDWYDSNSGVRYRQMGAALDKQSRPIQFNICIWGTANVWEWGARVGHSWRMSFDSSPTWDYIRQITIINAAHLDTIDFFSHNDMDMMEFHNGDLTIEEERTHFAVWVFMKSPILLGSDLNALTSEEIKVITTPDLLAFHQDPQVGTPAMPFTASASMPATSPPEYYSGKSSKGTHVFIINTSDDTATKTFDFANVPGLGAGTFKVRDMWTGKDVNGTFSLTSSFSINVAAHDTVAYLITKA